MNHLLKKHRLHSLVILLFEIIAYVVVILCYLYIPKADIPVTLFYASVGLGCFFVSLDFLVNLSFNYREKALKSKAEMTSAEVIGNDVNEAYYFGQIGLAVTDHGGNVLWTNDFLSKRIPNLIDTRIVSTFPTLTSLSVDKKEKKSVTVKFESRTYSVEFLNESSLYIFRDVTEYENELQNSLNQAPVIGYISIDNFSDVQMSISDDAHFTDMLTRTRAIIAEFGQTSGSMIKRIKDDRYIFVTTMEMYYRIFNEKFPVVDRVRNAFPNGFTLSIGISYGFPDYSKLSEEAGNALDVALSRGGDQTVIAPFGQSMVYIGGKSELKPARNKVKIRTLSNSFLQILRDYPKVLIIGHTNADFDAIGSCLGAYLLCQYVRVPAKICFENQLVENNARIAVTTNFSDEEIKRIFIDFRGLKDFVDKDTLLLCMDHNNPKISMFSDMQSKVKAVAVLDHHRMGPYTYDDPVFNGLDTSASSASEIVTSYITYSLDSIPVDERTATFLLAGITLDTHSFQERTSNSTFEAAAQLKNFGADSAKVDDFLKENLEEYRQKISILNNSDTPYYGTLVSLSPDTDTIPDVMLSKVANDAIQIRGIDCSFAIGRTGPHTIKISARSDGSVNCELLMQKLGGGGHFSMAASNFTDSTVEEVKKKLYAVLNDYLGEAKSVGRN